MLIEGNGILITSFRTGSTRRRAKVAPTTGCLAEAHVSLQRPGVGSSGPPCSERD